MTETADIVVVGAGMAGASVAANLAVNAKVLLIEAEAHAGYHSTGRSAAMFIESYGNVPVKALNRASRSHFVSPPDGFASEPLVRPRGWLMTAGGGQEASLEAKRGEPGSAFETIDEKGLLALVPAIRPGAVVAALMDWTATEVDVDALLQGYLRRFRAAGGTLVLGEPLVSLSPAPGGWSARTPAREISCQIVVDAAGAWADRIAGLAGVSPVGLQPMRRTAALIELPTGLDATPWPAVCDIDESFYFKPDAGQLLLSPAEESPVEPHDAFADDLALAQAAQRLCDMTGIEVRKAPRAWAGLRTFAPDRTPVVGFDRRSQAPFFWLAGQGGYGIQTAPALSQLASALMLGDAPPAFANEALLGALSPRRFEGS